MKVTIKGVTETYGGYEEHRSIEVLVDGAPVGSGWYGGEPEDNMECRTYSWVEPLIGRLAKALGAEVECVEEKVSEEDE